MDIENRWVNITITPYGTTDEDLIDTGSGNRSATTDDNLSEASVSPVTNCLISPPASSTSLSPSCIDSSSVDAWRERCVIITDQDHDQYVRLASEVVSDLIDAIPSDCEISTDILREDDCEVNRLVDLLVVQELSPSETSFNTAIVDTDTEFESADEYAVNISSLTPDVCKISISTAPVVNECTNDYIEEGELVDRSLVSTESRELETVGQTELVKVEDSNLTSNYESEIVSSEPNELFGDSLKDEIDSLANDLSRLILEVEQQGLHSSSSETLSDTFVFNGNQTIFQFDVADTIQEKNNSNVDNDSVLTVLNADSLDNTLKFESIEKHIQSAFNHSYSVNCLQQTSTPDLQFSTEFVEKFSFLDQNQSALEVLDESQTPNKCIIKEEDLQITSNVDVNLNICNSEVFINNKDEKDFNFNECDDAMPTADSQQSDDSSMTAVPSNDTTVLEVNPFETRSKMANTPPATLESDESNFANGNIVTNCSNVDQCEMIERQIVSPTFVETDDGGATQQCLMESSVSEDSGIDVPQATKDVSSLSTDGPINFSEAGPDVANVDKCAVDDEFRSATDFFLDPNGLDFLENRDSGKIPQSVWSRMSLYTKFDPLVQSANDHSPMSRRLTMWIKQQQESANRNMKPPTVKSTTPKSTDETLPVIDGQQTLIDLEASINIQKDDCPLFHEDKKLESGNGNDNGNGDNEEVRQMLKIQELLFQDRQLMKDREWDERVRSLESDKQRLVEQVQTLRDSQQQMRQIVAEYEKTISELISDKESDKRTMSESAEQITRERDQALEDLRNVETAFADLHRRYEKAKLTVEGFKKNEDTLKECVTTFQTKLNHQMEKYEKLRNRAEEKLESANDEIENLKKTNEAELAALRAQLKKAEMKVENLERNLEQKMKENSELTVFCDELIATVGKNA